MNRFERRARILRAKRAGCFDTDQFYLERAERARAARRVRAALRQLLPVVLITPRWSAPERFLDDVAVDLGIGEPKVEARVLSLAPVAGRNAVDSWRWILLALTEFFEIDELGPAYQAVDRVGFRRVLRSLFDLSLGGPPRALLLHGLHLLDVEARDDLIAAFTAHAADAGADRSLTVLLAGLLEGVPVEVDGALRTELPDYNGVEAYEALLELLPLKHRAGLETVVQLSGGVPEVLQRAARTVRETGGKVEGNDALWEALGPLADEMRSAIDIVQSEPQLADRLEQVARFGTIKAGDTDEALLRAGLLSRGTRRRRDCVKLRAPLLKEVATQE